MTSDGSQRAGREPAEAAAGDTPYGSEPVHGQPIGLDPTAPPPITPSVRAKASVPGIRATPDPSPAGDERSVSPAPAASSFFPPADTEGSSSGPGSPAGLSAPAQYPPALPPAAAPPMYPQAGPAPMSPPAFPPPRPIPPYGSPGAADDGSSAPHGSAGAHASTDPAYGPTDPAYGSAGQAYGSADPAYGSAGQAYGPRPPAGPPSPPGAFPPPDGYPPPGDYFPPAALPPPPASAMPPRASYAPPPAAYLPPPPVPGPEDGTDDAMRRRHQPEAPDLAPPAAGTGRTVSGSASVPMSNRVLPDDPSGLPSPQPRVYGRPTGNAAGPVPPPPDPHPPYHPGSPHGDLVSPGQPPAGFPPAGFAPASPPGVASVPAPALPPWPANGSSPGSYSPAGGGMTAANREPFDAFQRNPAGAADLPPPPGVAFTQSAGPATAPPFTTPPAATGHPGPEVDQPVPQIRNGRVLLAVLCAAVLLLVIPLGIVWLVTRPSDTSFEVGACVRKSGQEAVAAECTESGAYTVVSKVDHQDKCTDPPGQPYVVIADGGKESVLCLRPASGR